MLDEKQQREARLAFLEVVEAIRPDLHRYCSRLVGSVLDGEDLVQDTLAAGYYRVALLQDGHSFRPWLFTIAHNKCIDFLRRRRIPTEPMDDAIQDTDPYDSVDPIVGKEDVESALGAAVHLLAPLERACVLLKDVFDYSLKEAAAITGTTVGSVKSALHRGRTKLSRASEADRDIEQRPVDGHLIDLLQRYVALFNARDVEGLRTLISEDARFEMVGTFEGDGSVITDRYFVNYQRLPGDRKLAIGSLDGEIVVLGLSRESGEYLPVSAARVEVRDGKITLVRDYLHTGYLLDCAVDIRVA